LKTGLDLSAEAFISLSKRFKSKTKVWLKADRQAQRDRAKKASKMDIYDTAKDKGKAF
jgi:hypothetical protein